MNRKHLFYLGVAMATCSVLMTFTYGFMSSAHWSQGMVNGFFLSCAAVASASIAPFLKDFWDRGWFVSFAAGVVGLVICSGMDFTSNFGFVSSTRTLATATAEVQTIRYDDARNSVADKSALRDVLTKRLTDLKSGAGWVGVKTPEAFQAEIDLMTERIRQEEARGGCGPICLDLKSKNTNLRANLATAEAHERDSKMLAATVTALENLRGEAANVEKGTSFATAQSESLAQLISWSSEPSEGKSWTANTVVMLLMAIIATYGTMWVLYIASVGTSIPTSSATISSPRSTKSRFPVVFPALDALLVDLNNVPTRTA